MAVTTALDIINSSLRLLQVANPDTILTDDEANDALDALNLMLGGWSNESMMLHHIVKEPFVLVPNQASYTIGIGGNFNTTRPQNIESATIFVNGVDFPVQGMAFDDWGAIKLKTLATGYTEYYYLDQTFPLSTLYLYPVSTLASTLTLYSRKPFTEFSSLTATFSLPPGYARALKYGLAIELASEYQTSAGADILGLFMAAKAGLKRTNKRPLTLQVDPAFLSGRPTFNIVRGF